MRTVEDRRLIGLSPEVLGPDGRPRLLYRGTQRRDLHGVRGATSWTDAIAVALIWSAIPGDEWGQRKARFGPSSTVHAAYLALHNPLVVEGNSLAIADIMRLLRYGERDGITHEEVLRVYSYLHNRHMGKASGGPFHFVALDEDGDELDAADAPFSIRGTMSLITDLRDDFEYANEHEQSDTAARLIVDAYVLFDAPRVQKAAARLGYDGFIYWDIFDGCTFAAPELLGCDCEELAGIEVDQDVRYEDVITHKTFRPLSEESVVHEWDAPAELLVEDVMSATVEES